MEFFNKAKTVRLRSHLDKYLIADDDEETVKQSRNGSSRKARWEVELVAGKSHVVRLRSCHGRYLAAAAEPFLLGMTGKKVRQVVPATKADVSVEWEPIKDGIFVKMRAKSSSKFLRANGGTPPWRNSVTHDAPHRTVTQDWVLWEVEVVDISLSESESPSSVASPASSFSSLPEEVTGSETRSPSISRDGFRRSRFSSSPDDFSGSQGQSLSTLPNRSGLACAKQSGMMLFDKAKAVRFQSHLGKYLVADDDEQTVRQSRNGSSHKARWTVELVDGKSHVLRLKSYHGHYLNATDEPFLLGMTGKKVLQTKQATKADSSTEWEPIKEGLSVKLRSHDGKFLRANGGTPPWRNSVTHDIPHRTATQDWVLWGVDVVDISVSDSDSDLVVSRNISLASSFCSSVDDFAGSPDTGSPVVVNGGSSHKAFRGQSGMELFHKAKTVRLRSHHDKYLLAHEDQDSVCQDRQGSVHRANWTVEFVNDADNLIRLKSCYGKYLTATDEQYLLGVTGRRVVQSMPRKLDSKVEWEPIRDGFQMRFKTRYGNYLRANGGLPPWRNSITHDIPHRHTDWVVWEVDVVELRTEEFEPKPSGPTRSDSVSESEPSSPTIHIKFPRFSEHDLSSSSGKSEGRIIYYSVADDDEKFEEGRDHPSFHFKGHGLEELTEKLEEETGLVDIILCSRNPFNGKLYPLRLALPPNNANMHIVVVPSSSKVARDFTPEIPTSA
ncbi:Eukaryotic translation initiation factor 3 subunit D like [Actinidia chinensis var. chinensis]|uniref:Eukaryotic translation initiation factor 3 subunit D like n=1 Tax=Actinidia chinensis var. chinensis TaxID=1590841 RepID=A0A2R6P9F3_ACTCC|nr:Eukaryotic translation initiation factor 3 subunit D like [Actinidia chinensis var. chinensis]